MKASKSTFVIASLVLLPILFAIAQHKLAAQPLQNQSDAAGGVATLYALDPLMQTFCFADGGEGHVIQANEVRNRCSDMDFGNYNQGSFTVGGEGARLGAILDLGSPWELAHRYGYAETVGNGQGFASLRMESGKLVVLKSSRPPEVQQLKEASALFQEGTSNASAPVALGHIYLVRITDRFDKSMQRIVKFSVIAYTPKQSVTIRWNRL